MELNSGKSELMITKKIWFQVLYTSLRAKEFDLRKKKEREHHNKKSASLNIIKNKVGAYKQKKTNINNQSFVVKNAILMFMLNQKTLILASLDSYKTPNFF